MKKRLQIVLTALIILSSLLMQTSQVFADTFSPNLIINDAVFDNTNSMNAFQIDDWINKNFGSTSCISTSHGFSASDPAGYNPTNGFLYGKAVSAGHVIFDAAQAYDLNPEVLLVTLQKEQSLVSGSAGCGVLSYAGAAGYGCPDGGTSYNYSGVNLYATGTVFDSNYNVTQDGNPVTSVTGTCVNTASKVGFSQQVIHAAWLLKYGEQRSEGNVNWAIIRGSWDNSDDPQSCYSGPMTQGTWQRCPSGPSATYDGYTTIDGTAVHMDDGATAVLYWYTPHFSGNQHFFNIFVSWFGSPVGCPSIDSTQAYRLHNFTTGDYLYTQNASEVCQALKYYGYSLESTAFQPLQSTDANSVPVYRLSRNGVHLLTTSTVERDMAIQNYGFVLEGTPFDASSVTATGLQAVYRLSRNGTYFYTMNVPERDMMISSGYSDQGIVFYATPVSSRTAVYRLSRNGLHLFTTSAVEKSIALNLGYSDEGVAFYAQTGPTGDDMNTFRLVRDGRYLYTNSLTEEQLALASGYSLDRTYFYVYSLNYPGGTPVYRLCNPKNGDYLYTSNQTEHDQAIALYGYRDEGLVFDSSP